MKKTFLIVLSIFMAAATAQAHPPSLVEIEYVQAEGQLYVYMDHLSRDHRKHYIRKTDIFVNGKEVASQSNRQQIDPNAYAFSVNLEARENDEITVKAYSSEGGVGTASFVVPKKGEGAAKASSAVKDKVEAYKNRDTSSDVYESKEDPSDETPDVIQYDRY